MILALFFNSTSKGQTTEDISKSIVGEWMTDKKVFSTGKEWHCDANMSYTLTLSADGKVKESRDNLTDSYTIADSLLKMTWSTYQIMSISENQLILKNIPDIKALMGLNDYEIHFKRITTTP